MGNCPSILAIHWIYRFLYQHKIDSETAACKWFTTVFTIIIIIVIIIIISSSSSSSSSSASCYFITLTIIIIITFINIRNRLRNRNHAIKEYLNLDKNEYINQLADKYWEMHLKLILFIHNTVGIMLKLGYTDIAYTCFSSRTV